MRKDLNCSSRRGTAYICHPLFIELSCIEQHKQGEFLLAYTGGQVTIRGGFLGSCWSKLFEICREFYFRLYLPKFQKSLFWLLQFLRQSKKSHSSLVQNGQDRVRTALNAVKNVFQTSRLKFTDSNHSYEQIRLFRIKKYLFIERKKSIENVPIFTLIYT